MRPSELFDRVRGLITLVRWQRAQLGLPQAMGWRLALTHQQAAAMLVSCGIGDNGGGARIRALSDLLKTAVDVGDSVSVPREFGEIFPPDVVNIARGVPLIIHARGIPGPQGSKSFKGMTPKNAEGRQFARLVESSKKVKPWRKAVVEAAVHARTVAGCPMFDGPLVARMVFTLPKPASAPKRRTTFPDRMPDLSKLLRATEDALTTAGVWADDARIVRYETLAKVFPGEDPEALEMPGVRIEIRNLEATP